jgi:hypothetical protein
MHAAAVAVAACTPAATEEYPGPQATATRACPYLSGSFVRGVAPTGAFRIPVQGSGERAALPEVGHLRAPESPERPVSPR